MYVPIVYGFLPEINVFVLYLIFYAAAECLCRLEVKSIKGQKRQRFSVMHLKQFTQANHLHLQSNFSH